jgi:hypothetical protein
MISKEIEDGTIPDPAMMTVDPQTGQPMPTAGGGAAAMDLGQPIMEPDLRDSRKVSRNSSWWGNLINKKEI